MKSVTEKFAFRSNNYYQSLVNWENENDPIRRLVIPTEQELDKWGNLDVSNEEFYTVFPGLEHKYEDTVLFIINNVCAGYCRFCFRKRLFMDDNNEVCRDLSRGLEYVKKHEEITNILLSGGDPLILSTPKLKKIVQNFWEIDHIRIVRIGTKMPAFNPYRIINDPSLIQMFNTFRTNNKKIYIIVHFNHPRELTDEAIKAINLIQNTEVVTLNQTPILRGINDNSDILSNLFDRLSFIGISAYYVFQCRPTQGNKPFSIPVEKSYEIFENACLKGSGLSKRAKLVMSHSTGKIEIIGLTKSHVYLKYLRAVDPVYHGEVMIYKRNPNAYWLDDYNEVIDNHSFNYNKN